MPTSYPVSFQVDYPDRDLNRLSTFFRIVALIPIVVVSAAITGFSTSYGDPGATATTIVVGGIGILFVPLLLMILFRQKYPRWWYDWNQELMRFSNRIGAYLALLDDRYPSTDDDQAVALVYVYPDASSDERAREPADYRLRLWLRSVPRLCLPSAPAGVPHPARGLAPAPWRSPRISSPTRRR